MPTEAERAEQFVEDYEAREQARCERAAALSGDTEARNALALAWRPIWLWNLERQMAPLHPAGLEEQPCIISPDDHLLP